MGDVFVAKGNNDAWLLKLTGDGAVQWQKTFDNSSSDSFNFVQQTGDSG